MQQLSQLLTFVLIGNYLGPHVVGVMTMGLVATLFFATFLENGFADTLIQKANLETAHFDSAFWLMLGMGTLEGLVLWAATPLVAHIFSEPQINDILPLLALGLPCIALSACFGSMLRRQLKFRQLAIRSMLAYGLGFIAAFAMAMLGYGVYSLVAFFLVSRVLDAVLVFVVSGLRPGLKVKRAALREILDFGKHRVGHQVVSYITMNFDRFVIGVFFGPAILGLYAIAERLVGALNNGFSGPIQRVAFPVLSARQHDRDAFDRAMREFLTVANLLSLPAIAGLAATSYALFAVAFTSSWAPAAILMQIICFAALATPSNYVLTAATNALGRPALVLRLSLAVLIMRAVGSLVGAQISVVAVAVANAIVILLSLPMFVVAGRNLFAGKWRHLFGGAWVPALATVLMAAAALAVPYLLAGVNTAVVLLCQVAVGVVAYAILIWILAPDLYKRALQIFSRRAAGFQGAAQ